MTTQGSKALIASPAGIISSSPSNVVTASHDSASANFKIDLQALKAYAIRKNDHFPADLFLHAFKEAGLQLKRIQEQHNGGAMFRFHSVIVSVHHLDDTEQLPQISFALEEEGLETNATGHRDEWYDWYEDARNFINSDWDGTIVMARKTFGLLLTSSNQPGIG